MNWIKIVCDILDNRKIRMIRKGPEGNTLVLLWLLLLIEAGKCCRGGYLMVSDRVPYSPETISMLSDISLQTVQLGLSIFARLDMVDEVDGVIYIRNWGKYQSEDQLQQRRENDRKRKQLQRDRERSKITGLLESQNLSRDSHADTSADVTQEITEEEEKKTTTDTDVRLLLLGTPFSKLSESEINELILRHGAEKLSLAADIAAETWRRKPAEKSNPGGYLQSLCCSVVVPDWYLPRAVRIAAAEEARLRKIAIAETKKLQDTENSVRQNNIDEHWDLLSLDEQQEYIDQSESELPAGLNMPNFAIKAVAKSLAWENKLGTG